MPPVAVIVSNPTVRIQATLAAVGIPHSRNAAPRARSSRWARCISTATHEVPPAPETSTWCTPAFLSWCAARVESPHPVSLATTGMPSSLVQSRERRDPAGEVAIPARLHDFHRGVQMNTERVGPHAGQELANHGGRHLPRLHHP